MKANKVLAAVLDTATAAVSVCLVGLCIAFMCAPDFFAATVEVLAP